MSGDGAFELNREALEALAVATYSDLMSDPGVDPGVRKSAADSVMKALGKDAPVKQQGPQLVMNFGTGLKGAIAGFGQLQALMARPADDQVTT